MTDLAALRKRVARLPVSEPDARMRTKRLAHRYGEHETPVRGCPDCDLKSAEGRWDELDHLLALAEHQYREAKDSANRDYYAKRVAKLRAAISEVAGQRER